MTPKIKALIEALAASADERDLIDCEHIDRLLGLPGSATWDDTATALRALLTPRDPERYTATCRSSDRAGSGPEVATLLRVIAYALEEGEDVVDAIAQRYPTYVDPARCAAWLYGVADEAEDLVLLMEGSRVIPAARRDPRADPRAGDVLRWCGRDGPVVAVLHHGPGTSVRMTLAGHPVLRKYAVAGSRWAEFVDGMPNAQVLYVAPEVSGG